jgi:hypothetical protein
MGKTMSSEITVLSADDAASLKMAHQLLQNPGIVAKLSSLIGEPIEAGLNALPKKISSAINEAVKKSVETAFGLALKTMDIENSDEESKSRIAGWLQKTIPAAGSLVGNVFGSESSAAEDKSTPPKASNFWHKAAVATTGAVGGAFGLSAILIELPVSTTIMMRSIADVARSEGEDLMTQEGRAECVSVLAFGGRSNEDDDAEVGYFAVRQAMASLVTDAATQLAKEGSTGASAVLVQLVNQVAERFGTTVAPKVMAQLVPVVGAASGAAINTLFIDHFQDMARGHFTVRRLERKYTELLIRSEYRKLTQLALAKAESARLSSNAVA